MASLVLLKNPLAPHTREIYPLAAGTPVIDWLQEHHPRGFGMPIRFYVNGTEQDLDGLDYKVADDDVAIIALMPGDPGTITIGAILTQLAIAAVLAAASFAINYFFFRPTERASGMKGDPVSLYDVSTDQNAARLGEPIPVVYGTVLTSPDYVAQPYSFYEWSQQNYDQLYNGVQYLDLLLCVGQGNIDVANIFLGETASQTPDPGVVAWRAFKPAEHRSTAGVVSSGMGAGFYENVLTSPEVGNQEFVNPNDAAGYFATAKPGTIGNKIEIDIVWPGGLFDVDTGSNAGDLVGRDCTFTVYYQEMNDSDVRIGTEYSTTIWASTSAGVSVTGPFGGAVTTTSTSARNRTAIASPLRRTYRIFPPKAARWAVKIVRTSNAPNAKNGTDRFIWTGLRLFATMPTTVYGNVTLVAVRIKASQGLGTDASVRITCRAIRRLPPPVGGVENQTAIAIDAFADAYTNTVYGAARPRSELDLTTLNTLRTKWSAYQFNHVFRERLTVWEALRIITIPFGAEPLPVGPVMSIAADGIKTVRSMLFTDANIVEGTMNVNYSWDEEGVSDGVEIEYLDPTTFKPAYAKYPPTALRPDQYSVPGINSATHAAQFARLVWNRGMLQRKRITFDTELEGLLLQLGDRIGVSHNVPKWGDGGLVIGVSGNTLTVDHDLNWAGGTKQILLRATDGSVSNAITVTRGSADNKVVLPSAPPFNINVDNDKDYTSFAFGSSTTLVRDFIVATTTPTGENTVTIEAVNYDAGVYAGAMSYMLSA